MKRGFAGQLSTSLILFLFFFSIYLFTMSGVIRYGDETEKYRVAQSIVERHDVSFRPTAYRNATGTDGRTYSIYEMGQSLLQVPFYLLGRAAAALSPVSDSNWMTQLTVGLLNPLATALTCVVLYLTCSSLGFSAAASGVVTIVFGLGTIAWPYAKGFTREPILTLLLLGSFLAVARFEKTRAVRWLVVAGVVCGYLVFTKFIQAATVPLFLLYVIAVAVRESRAEHESAAGLAERIVETMLLFGFPAILFLAVQSLYSLARFGTLMAGIAGTRNNPVQWIWLLLRLGQPDAAVPGLLFSADKSVFLYSPPVVLFFWAWFRWVRVQPRPALLCLGIILVEFAAAISRPDWDGGSWWGPRYLVQLTPFLLLPVGAVLSAPRRSRIFVAVLVALSALGIAVQVAGALADARDYLDVTGHQIELAGQLDFLRHGALDSLVLSPGRSGGLYGLNPFGVVLVVTVLALGVIVIRRLRASADVTAPCRRCNLALLGLVLVVESVAFVSWIVVPYGQVRAAQGDNHFVAGERFMADGRRSEATALYMLALDRGTNYSQDVLARLDELMPLAPGESFTAHDLAFTRTGQEIAEIGPDDAGSLFGEDSLLIRIPGDQDGTALAATDWIPAQPATTYELSGWIKTQSIYGTGAAVISVAEDNGSWKKPRTVDILRKDETGGWLPFRGTVVTLPTTQRLFISVALWDTYGAVWVDHVQLAKVTNR